MGSFIFGPEEFELFAWIVDPVGASLRLILDRFFFGVLLLGSGDANGTFQAADGQVEVGRKLGQGALRALQLELGDGDSLGLGVDGGIQRFCRRVGLLEKLQLDLKFRKGLLGLA